jgi:hypothetical protein
MSTLGEILAPILEKLGLCSADKAYLSEADCLIEDDCTCRICVPPPKDYNTWMYKIPVGDGTTTSVYTSYCVAISLIPQGVFETIELIDYERGWPVEVSVYDLSFTDRINEIVTRNTNFFKRRYENQLGFNIG